jgi:hypothetical protein
MSRGYRFGWWFTYAPSLFTERRQRQGTTA